MLPLATLLWSLTLSARIASGSATTMLDAGDIPKPEPAHPVSIVSNRNGLKTCEARTINYITHTLPQICPTSSRQIPPPTVSATRQLEGHELRGDESQNVLQPTTTRSDLSETESQVSEPVATSFMSFEDWKEMMLRRAGQDPQHLRARKVSDHQTMDRYPSEVEHAGLGEEGEISLNFETLEDGAAKKSSKTRQTNQDIIQRGSSGSPFTTEDEDEQLTSAHLSKDAGKTCKERFSYSSFDAGATILKTSPGAKNAKAILVENKDSYMLLECDARTKYVIVELSDDISIDTVVLANFEFFSSMVRHFRVSVSDRYPVKLEKWRTLGTFEARNSRAVQPFLVENPQIWAKYVRIEFLTHFGNEYYCPISLLRIHGSRMLDSWKESESPREEEITAEGGESSGRHNNQDASHISNGGDFAVQDRQTPANVTLWKWPYGVNATTSFDLVCPAPHVTGRNASVPDASSLSTHQSSHRSTDRAIIHAPPSETVTSVSFSSLLEKRPSAASFATPPSSSLPPELPQHSEIHGNDNSADSLDTRLSSFTSDRLLTATSTSGKASFSSGTNGKSRSTGTVGASIASPTMQEGFFNSITKRLQQVELNLTLSMKYVEDQSKHLQEALQAGEQKQQAKIVLFLDQLNRTVLADLRGIREQYDQIWQSTVVALESQKDRSERDMMALSSRLNLLADEVVFQKRMAIVQAIILLSCLFLIIFSRGVSLPSLAPLLDQVPVSAIAVPSPPGKRHAFQEREDYGSDGDESESLEMSKRKHDSRFAPDGEERFLTPTNGFDDGFVRQNVSYNAGSAAYHRLSPPLSLASNEDSSTSDSSDFMALQEFSDSCRMAGVLHGNSRKPLPSLPEHPASTDEAPEVLPTDCRNSKSQEG